MTLIKIEQDLCESEPNTLMTVDTSAIILVVTVILCTRSNPTSEWGNSNHNDHVFKIVKHSEVFHPYLEGCVCHLRVIKSNLRCSYNYLKTSTVDYDHPRDYAKVTLEVTMLQGANVLFFALEYNVGLSKLDPNGSHW